jgi:sulfate/thiosulfate transport system permease protein
MNEPAHTRNSLAAPHVATQEPPLVRGLLIMIAVGFAGLFLLLPLLNVFAQALGAGLRHYGREVWSPETTSAIRLTLLVAVVAVPLNTVFGLLAAWTIARFEFRGKALLLTLIDMPFSISPVVCGLMLVLLFGARGLLGEWLQAHGLKVIFAVPGMVLATMFVTLPFVARELIPAMQAQGSEQEQAALTLGASGWQTFWHVTLPSVKWGLLYGVILCNARAMGEFGAVSVVSGHITGETDTLPLRVDKLYHEFDAAAPFAVASLLTFLALVTLALKCTLEWREARGVRRTQQGVEGLGRKAEPAVGQRSPGNR